MEKGNANKNVREFREVFPVQRFHCGFILHPLPPELEPQPSPPEDTKQQREGEWLANQQVE